MIAPWIAIAAVLALLAASMALLSAAARRLGASAEGVRKLLHVEMALVTLAFPWLFSGGWPVIVLACVSVAWFRLVRASDWLEVRFGYALRATRRDSHGETWFACGVCAAFLWSRCDPVAYGIAILVLALADTAAAIVGQRYGRVRAMPGGARKSFAGSSAFFVVTLLITFGGLVGAAGFRPGDALAAALQVAAITTGIEALLGAGLDNLFVPVGVLASLEACAFLAAAQS